MALTWMNQSSRCSILSTKSMNRTLKSMPDATHPIQAARAGGLPSTTYNVRGIVLYQEFYIIKSWHSGNTVDITGPLWGESTGHRWILLRKDQWCGAMMFCLLLVWTSCWTSREFWIVMGLMWRHCVEAGIILTWFCRRHFQTRFLQDNHIR